MSKKLLISVISVLLLLVTVLFFVLPRPVLLQKEILYISVDQVSGSSYIEITDQLNIDEFKELLTVAQCKPIIDATHFLRTNAVKYAITIHYAGGNTFHLSLGNLDLPGDPSLINKLYTGNTGFPSLKYRILEPETIIEYLNNYS